MHLEIQIKLPEIPLDMSVHDACDNKHVEVKQEPLDSDQVKSEDFPQGLGFDDPCSDSHNISAAAQFQKVTKSGKLLMIAHTTGSIFSLSQGSTLRTAL